MKLILDSRDCGDLTPSSCLRRSTMPITSSVQQPKMFQGVLKEYQLKGFQWLVNCYEQVWHTACVVVDFVLENEFAVQPSATVARHIVQS